MSVIHPESIDVGGSRDVTRVVVGSTNPVKIAAVRAVLARSGCGRARQGIAVASGVSDQPVG